MNNNKESIVIRMRWDTVKSLRRSFKEYKKETFTHYFQRLAEHLRRERRHSINEHHAEEAAVGNL